MTLTLTRLLKVEVRQNLWRVTLAYDIAAAQEALEKVGLIDRIDLIVVPSIPLATLEKEIRKVIPQGTEIRRTETRSGQIEKMVSAFHLNLTALSLISLIVGMFLIYNAISTSVIQRRREIGILRSIGVTRTQILILFIGEAGIIGALGGLLGIGTGIALAKVMLYFVSRTITALYILVKAETLSIPPLVLIKGFGLAVIVSVFASLGPGREASRIAPREALAMGTLESKVKVRIKRFSCIGLGLLLVALLSALQKPIAHQPLFGFLAALLIVIGVSFLVPLITSLLNRLLSPFLHFFFGVEGKLASRYIQDSMVRTVITIAALMTALSMFISISIMILSFRKTVDLWVEQSINGDVFIFPGSIRYRLLRLGSRGSLKRITLSSWSKSLGSLQGTGRGISRTACADCFRGRGYFPQSKGDPLYPRIPPQDSQPFCLWPIRPCHREFFITAPGGGRGADQTGHTPRRTDLSHLGVFYDYSNDWGMILIEKKVFQSLWNDETIHSVGIYLKKVFPSRPLKR